MSGPDSIGGESLPAPTLNTHKVIVGPTLPEAPIGSLQQSGMNTRAAEVAVFVALGVAVLFVLLPLSSSNAVATEEEELDAGWVQRISAWFGSDAPAEEDASAQATYSGSTAAVAPAMAPAEAPSDSSGGGDDAVSDYAKAPAEAPNEDGTGGGYYVDVANTTGNIIQAIYINGVSATDWGPNRLDGEQLQDGYKIRVHLGVQQSPIFDIRLLDVEGNSYTYAGVDVSKHDITASLADKDANDQ